MEHLDVFALYRPLDNLEQVLSELRARDLHKYNVTHLHVRYVLRRSTHFDRATLPRQSRCQDCSMAARKRSASSPRQSPRIACHPCPHTSSDSRSPSHPASPTIVPCRSSNRWRGT